MTGCPDSAIECLLQKDGLQELEQLQNLLHLFHHRNKNQHRRSIWWRSFQNFRRELRCLLDEAGRLTAATAPSSRRVWPKGTKGIKARMAMAQKDAARKPQIETRLRLRFSWWTDCLVEQWWIAFTHLLTLNQFTQLGLFLIAALARISRLTNLTPALEQLANTETEALIARFANEETPEIFGAIETLTSEDVGEVVRRRENEQQDQVQDSRIFSPSTHIETKPNQAETVAAKIPSTEGRAHSAQQQERNFGFLKRATGTKKRKAGDAIDDMFRDFL